jgi:hypothetical protein
MPWAKCKFHKTKIYENGERYQHKGIAYYVLQKNYTEVITTLHNGYYGYVLTYNSTKLATSELHLNTQKNFPSTQNWVLQIM